MWFINIEIFKENGVLFFIIKIMVIFTIYQNIIKYFRIDTDIQDFVEAIILVGLQKNLIDKLNYITYKHPIRYLKLF